MPTRPCPGVSPGSFKPAATPLPLSTTSRVRGVTFGPLDARDLAHYLASREWEGRAGAYAIQGLGASLVATVISASAFLAAGWVEKKVRERYS